MTSRMLRTAAAFLAAVLTDTACRDDSTPSGPSAPPAPAPSGMAPVPGEDPLLAHARAIPGFGGLFLGPDGMPTVYLTDLRQRPTAERVLAGELRRLGSAPSQLRVLKGDYDFLQLHGWSTRAMPEALTVPGAVFVDVDEGSNRLRIGVETSAAEAAVRGRLARLVVPDSAVVVQRADPFKPLATLQENVAPERGGLLITSGSGKGCTLGFNTRIQSGFIVRRSFITNSHCTDVSGGVEGTQFHQPVIDSTFNLIGTEVADPSFMIGGPCPAGRKCRWSDAARVLYRTGAGSDLGGIARTAGIGSFTIDPANPLFNITAEVPDPLQFSIVNKIGIGTGWTQGIIFATCAAVNKNGTNITVFCQDLVNGANAGGDSGSPVFSWSGSGNSVSLLGITWGGNGTIFSFSPLGAIEFELGPLTTF